MAQREAEGRRVFIYVSHTGAAKVEDGRGKKRQKQRQLKKIKIDVHDVDN